jgi:hypothetical protein
MAKNREMLKEAIAEAKAVKEMAIANAKAALEEAFTPQLKSMLSLKLQEMEEMDEMEDKEMYEMEDKEDMNEKKENMMEVDLEELLAELELEEDEVEENLYEAEEGEEDEGEATEDVDLSDEEIKDMIEDVLAQMIKDGEIEAGPNFEAEEGEEEGEEEASEEDEEEVNLEELLKEIEEMEEKDEYPINEWEWAAGDPMITIGFLIGAVGGLAAFGAAYFASRKGAKKEDIERQIKSLILSPTPKKKEMLQNIMKDLEKNPQLKSEFQSTLDKIQSSMGSLEEAEETGDPMLDALKSVAADQNISVDKIVKGSEEVEELVKDPDFKASVEKLDEKDELEEALSTIKTLKAEINEINLLNAKLLYTNKIFKAKNLNENQKVKVLSSFDKAKNVGEVKMVYETLNEGIKVAKTTIKENLGRASKSTVTPTAKQPIVESNDVFKRMQKLAGLI